MAANNMVSISVEIPTDTGGTVKRTLKFKSFSLLPVGLIRATRDNAQEQMWRILEWACDAKGLEIVDQIPSAKVEDLMLEMQAASQVDVGESARSSTSSRSTARPSKRTLSTKV